MDKDKVIFKISKFKQLNKDARSYGLDYCIPQTKFAFHEIYLCIRKTYYHKELRHLQQLQQCYKRHYNYSHQHF